VGGSWGHCWGLGPDVEVALALDVAVAVAWLVGLLTEQQRCKQRWNGLSWGQPEGKGYYLCEGDRGSESEE
jgi:hypothetical protein